MGSKLVSGLLATVLAGCSLHDDRPSGVFFNLNQNANQAFRGKRVKILYCTADEKVEYVNGRILEWPKPVEPDFIKEIQHELLLNGAYVSPLPFNGSQDNAIRMMGYEKGDWDCLVLSDWDFNPFLMDSRMINSTYLADNSSGDIRFGWLGGATKPMVLELQKQSSFFKGISTSPKKEKGRNSLE